MRKIGRSVVGVVIPVLNEEAHIESTVKRIIENSAENIKLEVLVVDGGSSDCTVQKVIDLDLPCVTVISNKKVIQSAAVNLGFSILQETCDYFLRVDAHCAYPQNFVTQCLDALLEHDADSVVVVMDTLGGNSFQCAVGFVSDRIYAGGGSPHRGGTKSGWVSHGHHAMFRKEAFMAVGGYDEAMEANEDAELDARLVSDDFRIYLDSSIRIGYYPRKDALSLWKQYYRNGAGRAQTAIRHKVINVRQILPVLLVIWSGIALISATVFHQVVLTMIPYLVFLLLAMVHSLMSSGLRVAIHSVPAIIMMHFGFGLGYIKVIKDHLKANICNFSKCR
tara:strand:- start:1477 stop:2481 length:1005 start_codon:yes stop_codon:yes gene_type:complete